MIGYVMGANHALRCRSGTRSGQVSPHHATVRRGHASRFGPDHRANRPARLVMFSARAIRLPYVWRAPPSPRGADFHKDVLVGYMADIDVSIPFTSGR